jgi:hypothetical protein
MLARSGAYAVKSRLMDDDEQVWLDFEWGKLSRKSLRCRTKLTNRVQAGQRVVDCMTGSTLHRLGLTMWHEGTREGIACYDILMH